MRLNFVDRWLRSLRQPVKPVWGGECDHVPPGGYPLREHQNVIPDQVVVTGPRAQVHTLVEGLASPIAADVPPEPIEEIDLSFLGGLEAREPGVSLSAEAEEQPRFEDEELANLVTSVYRLPQGLSVEDAIADLYYRANQQSPPVHVYAEPNRLIGGSSGCIEGGPAGTGGPARGEAKFWSQWALKAEGVSLSSSKVEVDEPREDVRVAVFDTSPFEKAGKWNIWWMEKEPLNLCVWHPEPWINPIPTEPDAMSGSYLDHGLFVSSLVHAVAAQSEIHLIRVLNGHNLGDVTTLIRALGAFLRRDLARRGGKTLDGTVLNLSLGVVDEPDSEAHLADKVRERVPNLAQLLSSNRLPTVGLETVLRAAQRAGAIVVACSGNDSLGKPAQEPEPPACYPFVIDVAGHNKAQKRSNFSNKGRIAAPAGEIPDGQDRRRDKGKMYDPDHWLVGLSMQSGQRTGYMYWMGTSFAAPLVAGGAARFLLEGGAPEDAFGGLSAAGTGDPNLGKGPFKIK